MEYYYLNKKEIIYEFGMIINFAEQVGCTKQQVDKNIKNVRLTTNSKIYKYIKKNNLEKLLIKC